MFYEAELHFIQSTFLKMHLQTLLFKTHTPADQPFDCGLRRSLGRETEYQPLLQQALQRIRPNTIYRGTDHYLCSYIFLMLPDLPDPTILMVGPYLTKALTHETLLEHAEAFRLPPGRFQQMKNVYSGIPVLPETNPVFAMLDAFAEHIWGGADTFTVEDLNQELLGDEPPLPAREMPAKSEDLALNMHLMEQRYAFENELMQAVTQGLTHKAELLLSNFTPLSFERRLSDPVRNLKNYCIIMNTLLRKAAEQGGVHPVYLDRTSSSFAAKIEQLPSAEAVGTLMSEMLRSYSRLVKRHAMKRYSPPVQKAITYIDSDLTADLSLRALASMQNVSASYLSARFRQETGQTLTDHVNQKRVQHAMQLLSSTKLQIQTIAQHCGILDVHYFTKVFKKYTQQTPKEYRESLRT